MSTLPFLGNTLDMMKFQFPRLHDWIAEECQRLQGKPWRLQVIGAPPLVVVCTVDAFEDVMKRQFEIFDKGPRVTEILQDTAGDGIFGVDGESWYLQRKTLSHLFTSRSFRENIMVCIQKYVRKLCSVLATHESESPNTPIAINKIFNQFTFDTFSDIGFGLAIDKVIVLNERRFHQPDWLWKLKRFLNIGYEKELADANQVANQVIYQVIYDILRQKNDPDAKRVSIPELSELKIDTKFLRDIGMGIMLAGKDTTALTMSWFFIMLSQHRRVEEALRAEIKRKLPKLVNDPEYVPTPDELDTLVYLEAVIRETLRLYPVLPLNAKEANRDVTLSDGTFIKKGTRVYIPSYALGRMKSVWGPDAAEFLPERWLEVDQSLSVDATPRLRNTTAFQFPAFNAGPRTCLGMKFAMLELKASLACLVTRFHFRMVTNPHPTTYEIAITLQPKGAVMAFVEKAPDA
ncbi:TPA: hypothetical protein N0F65_004859 [Lagenidium giganteum]|uniref:Cytochrome P450 n=1 Tax=Lagenidium giganteum TaxID=4803 RepID=A0AAV2Z604_9STRA|nr:TPA: hypothetical protein N0F65_004859 [Lagenidium giganteum]